MNVQNGSSVVLSELIHHQMIVDFLNVSMEMVALSRWRGCALADPPISAAERLGHHIWMGADGQHHEGKHEISVVVVVGLHRPATFAHHHIWVMAERQ